MANAEDGRDRSRLHINIQESTWRKTKLASIAILVVILAVIMFVQGGFIGPEIILVGLLLGALVLGQAVKFIRDWLPFVFILFGWQMLRGYADDVAHGGGFPLHIVELVRWDEWFFRGHIPTVWLQQHLFNPYKLHWYDLATTGFWAFHFVLPLFFAFFLWATRRPVYWKFAVSLVVLSFAGFATYILFPAAPPWYASAIHVIHDPVFLVRVEVLNYLHSNADRSLSWIMSNGNPDEVAAMPSLHASYPTLVFWFCVFYWRKAIPLAVLYCFGLWFSVIYIGDHYFVDVLAGFLYGTATFFVMHGVFRLVSRVTPVIHLRSASQERGTVT